MFQGFELAYPKNQVFRRELGSKVSQAEMVTYCVGNDGELLYGWTVGH